MLINIALFLAILVYSVIVSQSFMYILALRDTQLNMSVRHYIEFRKLIDRNMQVKFRYVTYSALLISLVLIPIAFSDGSASLIASTLVAFIMLFADTLITVKGNLPINSLINQWTADQYPANWSEVRAKWLRFYQYRQILNISGFASLIAGAIFR